jgi:hypothetical protein
VEETRHRIPLAPRFVRFAGDALFFPASLEHRVLHEQIHAPAQRREVVLLEAGEEITECAAILEKIEDGGGDRVGGDTSASCKILENEMFSKPVADKKRRTPKNRLDASFSLFLGAHDASRAGCLIHRFYFWP